jgi:hypothetical protein
VTGGKVESAVTDPIKGAVTGVKEAVTVSSHNCSYSNCAAILSTRNVAHACTRPNKCQSLMFGDMCAGSQVNWLPRSISMIGCCLSDLSYLYLHSLCSAHCVGCVTQM